MFLRNLITTSTESYSEQIDRLKNEIENADAIVIGAGAGMSTSAGFTYDGERFEKHFADFRQEIRHFTICIQAVFILTRHLKNIGRGGHGISMSTAMIYRQAKPYIGFIKHCKRYGLFCTNYKC